DSTEITVKATNGRFLYNNKETEMERFMLRELIQDTTLSFTAKGIGGTVSEDITITVLPPDTNTLNIIGEWKGFEWWIFDRTDGNNLDDFDFVWKKIDTSTWEPGNCISNRTRNYLLNKRGFTRYFCNTPPPVVNVGWWHF